MEPFPGADSTPLETSIPYGCTVATARATLAGFRPPARMMGPYCLAIRAASQLKVRPVPPYDPDT